jgi:hypothetical protein
MRWRLEVIGFFAALSAPALDHYAQLIYSPQRTVRLSSHLNPAMNQARG